MKKLNLLTVLVVVLYSCSNSEEGNSEVVMELGLQETKEFMLDGETPQYNSDYQFFENSEGRYVSFLNSRNNSIYIYNYDSRELEKKIQFDQEGPNGTGQIVRSYYYHNKDSIFIHGLYSRRFYLFNDRAELQDSYPLDMEKPRVSMPMLGHLKPLYFIHGKLYINNGGACNSSSEDSSIPPVVIIYNTKSKKIEYDLDYPKEFYSEESGWPMTLCNVFNTYDSENQNFIYSYAMTPFVIVTDHKGIAKKIDFSSDVVDQELFETVDMSTVSHPTDYMKISGRYAQYGPVYYDPYRKYYLRFANNPVPESRLAKNIFKPIQNIIVKDQDFETIGEIMDFDGSNYFFFTEEGLNQITVYEDNEDIMVVKVFDYGTK